MIRVPIYIKTEPVADGLPPERTYAFEPAGDCVLLGVAVLPYEKFHAGDWAATWAVRMAVGGTQGSRWEPRDFAMPEDAARSAVAS